MFADINRSTASADSHFDFLDGGIELAVGLDDCAHIRGLAHLDPRRDVAFAAAADVETRGERERIFLGEDRDALGVGNLAGDRDRHNGAVLGDVGRGNGDVLALDQIGCAQAFERIGNGFRFKRALVPRGGPAAAATATAAVPPESFRKLRRKGFIPDSSVGCNSSCSKVCGRLPASAVFGVKKIQFKG